MSPVQKSALAEMGTYGHTENNNSTLLFFGVPKKLSVACSLWCLRHLTAFHREITLIICRSKFLLHGLFMTIWDNMNSDRQTRKHTHESVLCNM